MKTPRLALLDLCCGHLKPVLTDADLFPQTLHSRSQPSSEPVSRSLSFFFFPFYLPQRD